MILKTRATIAAGATASLLLLLGAGLRAAPPPPAGGEILGSQVKGFRLPDTEGKTRALRDFEGKQALVLVFIGTDCPVANGYTEALTELQARYAERVQFLGVNANPDEQAEAVARHAKEYRLSFPVLRDEKQFLANRLDARVTPEAFILDRERIVRYRGRIDDSYASRTKKRPQAGSKDLEAALDAVLAGKPVKEPFTQAIGCAILRPEKQIASAAVTYHKDVAPILQARCQSCHRPGQVAPFSLLTYRDAKNWAREVKEFTGTRQMPPWKAEPGHGDFMDSRRMSDAEVATLAKWADTGAPEGSPKDAAAPKQWTDDWMLGKPDLVLTVPEEYHVAATGDDIFRVFVLPTELQETANLVAIEVRPGNPRVVHHVVAFADTSGKARQLDEQDPGPGYDCGPGGIKVPGAGIVGVWAPGNFTRRLPAGTGRALKKGTDIAIQVHYHKTGKPEADRTTIGLHFSKEPVKQPVHTAIVGPFDIDIPADAKRHPVSMTFKFPVAGRIYNIMPHMHLLGKEIRVTAKLPDGSEKELVWVKDWDYRWQDTYWYREPLDLPGGTVLKVAGYYDNTPENPLNPSSPPRRVRFGEQTTDEMCFAIMDVAFGVPGK